MVIENTNLEMFGLTPEETTEDDILVAVGIMLKVLRQNLNLTQSQASERTNLASARVSNLESGDFNPTLKTLFKYVKSLGGELTINIGPRGLGKSYVPQDIYDVKKLADAILSKSKELEYLVTMLQKMTK